ncbi:hypothetical protein [Marinigracilibium pacificum]|nr:hypothetical protein [Marinigracilibium pacificum]
MKQNRDLLKKNRVWEKIKHYSTIGDKGDLVFLKKNASKEKLEEIRKRAIAENNKQIIKIIIKLVIVGTIIAITWWMMAANTINNHNF